MEISLPKLYRYDIKKEHCQVAIPFPEGALTQEDQVQILQDGVSVPTQMKVTSRYEDGSIRFLFVRFLADLPANKKAVLEAVWDSGLHKTASTEDASSGLSPVKVLPTGNGYAVQGRVNFAVSNGGSSLFDWLEDGCRRYEASQFVGPLLEVGDGNQYDLLLDKWQVLEQGPLTAVLTCMGSCHPKSASFQQGGHTPTATFQIKLTTWADKPWVEISHRIINSTDQPLHAASLVFAVLADEHGTYDASLPVHAEAESGDSAGEGAANRPAQTALSQSGTSLTAACPEIFSVTGFRGLPEIEGQLSQDSVRTCAASSNYKTNFLIGKDGASVSKVVDDAWLIREANEHFAEVFYGTFFADRTDSRGGVCATIFQAQQNYPKAVKADQSGIYVMLVPQGVGKVVLESGMSREQRFLLHFHDAKETLTEIDNRSLIYQMPDRPSLPMEAFRYA